MKSASLIATMICLLSLSACAPNLPPSPDIPAPSSSPTPSSTPTPNPETTPLPSPDTNPSSEASVEPSPSTDASPLPSQTVEPSLPVMAKFRAAFVNTQREVVPAANTEFNILPYPLDSLRKAQAEKNDAPEKPAAPVQTDAKYQRSQKSCTSTECTVSQIFDAVSYQEDLDTYNDTTLPAWETQAYQGLETVLATEGGGRSPQKITTDANGEASVSLSTGRWYISGTYTWRDQIVVWDEITRDIREDDQPLDVIL